VHALQKELLLDVGGRDINEATKSHCISPLKPEIFFKIRPRVLAFDGITFTCMGEIVLYLQVGNSAGHRLRHFKTLDNLKNYVVGQGLAVTNKSSSS
jgi:hypothetical protein